MATGFSSAHYVEDNYNLRVSHLNTMLSGGAAIAARRIFDGLIDLGLDGRFHYMKGSSSRPHYEKVEVTQSILTPRSLFESTKKGVKIAIPGVKHLVNRPRGLELFSPATNLSRLTWDDFPSKPDVIHLHWISSLFDYDTFLSSIPCDIPIVWTLHDMNAFTGGCHYSNGCTRFNLGCGFCPQLAHPGPTDLSNVSLAVKMKNLKNRELHIVADSFWLADQARESSLFQSAASIQTIHYGVEIDDFCPQDQAISKRSLGIPPEAKVLAFGAEYKTPRKGWPQLAKALEYIADLEINVVILRFGPKPKGRDVGGKLKVIDCGYLSSRTDLAQVYSAADVFVMPSIFEAFGQVALEAMSCGTPVVSFDSGGPRDIVKNGQTGFLVKSMLPYVLAEKIIWLLRHQEEAATMGKKARAMVEKDFTLPGQAKKYLDLYHRICSR